MKGFEILKRKETPAQKVFQESVSTVSIEELPISFDGGAVKNLEEAIGDTNLFILGEVHGVKENADVIYTLFKKFGFRQLGLEWNPSLKKVAEKFMDSGKLDFRAIADSPDGRITTGHFALLKKLKTEGLIEQVVCFDSKTWRNDLNSRDADMAKNILAARTGVPMLVVAGGLHSQIKPAVFDGATEEYHPMGQLIHTRIPNVPTGKVEYFSGEYHNVGLKKFADSQASVVGNGRFYQDHEGLYVFELPEAHAALVPNPDDRP